MADKPISPEQKVVFGVAPEVGTDNAVVLLQVPPGGWEYMKDGTYHTFDLTILGLPIKILLAGCESRADAIRKIEKAAAANGLAILAMPSTDFGTKKD